MDEQRTTRRVLINEVCRRYVEQAVISSSALPNCAPADWIDEQECVLLPHDLATKDINRC